VLFQKPKNLPLKGGWADVNESAAEAVVREVFEESGYRTRAVKLVALYDRNKHPHPPYLYHAYKVFFQCDLLDANPADVIDSAGVGFFRADALPEFSLTRVLPGQIARLFEHYRNPSLPAEFD
jgi:ADP-ribose pyrophosphatase YjhB (NUDIX family)